MHVHDHDHSHRELSVEEIKALMGYMKDHNLHHSEELHDLSHNLEHNDKAEAAELLHKASHLLEDSAELIAKALEKLEG